MGRKRTRPGLRRGSRYDEPSHAGAGPGILHRCVDGLSWRSSQTATLLAACLIALATVAAYSNSFAGPFVFDDKPAIEKNLTIRQIWPVSKALCPPNEGESVSGRPLLNLSFAVNYAISGLDVWSYHAANLAIHLLGSLLLFGIVRRTFQLPAMCDKWGAAATPLALVIALLWAVHPLQTESVTYIIQRAESLVGLFYLLTLYCFLRGLESTRSVIWHSAAALACLLGMASKEVMVSAPLIVLLYDRAFVAGSFREALQRRSGFYAALVGTWLLLAWLVISAGGRGGTAGFGLKIDLWSYLCTQFGVIVHYLRLCVWPHPLVLDYGWPVARTASEILPGLVVIGGLALLTVWAIFRWPKWGFLGTWFFLILAPTCSIIPLADPAFEHRMYLPLASVVTGLVMGGYLLGQRLVRRQRISPLGLRVVVVVLVMSVAAALGIATLRRNMDYRSEFSIWQDTANKAPANSRPHNNLGNILMGRRQIDEAIAHFDKALEIQPDYANAHNNLGLALVRLGRVDEGIAHYRQALDINPQHELAENNFGNALAERGQFDEAASHYEKALKIEPDYAEAHNNLANILAGRGQFDEAVAHYEKALEINRDYADARRNCDVVLSQRKEISRGLAEQRELLRSRPNDVALLNGVAWILATSPNAAFRNAREAVELAERAVRLSGHQEPAILDTLAAAYAEAGRFSEAAATAQQALDLAKKQDKQTLAESLRARLQLYQAQMPFRQPHHAPLAPPARPQSNATHRVLP
jgi:protein O-mannosyl-transferase